MAPRKKSSAVAAANGEPKQSDEKTVDGSKKSPVIATQKKTRSASAAFGDRKDASKKQNTSSSSTKLQDQLTTEDTKKTAATPNNIQTAIKNCSRGSDVDRIDSAVSYTNPLQNISSDNEEEDEPMLDLVPPAHTISTRPKAKTTVNVKSTGTEKLVEEQATMIATATASSPQNVKDDKSETRGNEATDKSHNSRRRGRESTSSHGGGLLRFGLFCFANLAVFSGMIWSGLLLSERATYQLESLECREQLQQAHHAMGIPGDFEDSDNNSGDNSANDKINTKNRLDEHRFYWEELEAQVRYWKKEAKNYQQYGDGFKEQCREDMQHLLTEVLPQAENQQ